MRGFMRKLPSRPVKRYPRAQGNMERVQNGRTDRACRNNPKVAGMSKYKNVKTGIYASKREAARAGALKILEKAGCIQNLREQVPYELSPAVRINGRMSAARKYIADFVYLEDGVEIVEDVKGAPLTAVYILKRHLMAVVHGISIRET